MSHTQIPIPFWDQDIRIGLVESASTPALFHTAGKQLKEIGAGRSLSLYQYDDHYLLEIAGGDFIEFHEALYDIGERVFVHTDPEDPGVEFEGVITGYTNGPLPGTPGMLYQVAGPHIRSQCPAAYLETREANRYV